MANRIQVRRGTAAQWAAANPVLAAGEPGMETDTGLVKVGDGSASWSSLAASKRLATELGVGQRISAFAPLKTALAAADRSAAIQVLGDSTGNDTNEWVYTFAQSIAAQYPAWSVHYRLWSDATQQYGARTTIQTGTAGERYLDCSTGTTTRRMDASVSPHISGVLDVRVKVSMADWTPSAAATFAGRSAADPNRSWYVGITTAGTPSFSWTPTGLGAGLVSKFSTAGNLGFVDGSTNWLRYVFIPDNGAGGYDVKFYTSADGVTWTQHGATVTTAGVATLFNNSAVGYECGGIASGVGSTGLKLYEVQIRDGVDGPNVVPALPDLWPRYNVTGALTVGAPVLTIVNGSHPGAEIGYLGDAVRLPKMTPDYGQLVTLLSDSHNEGLWIGPAWTARYDTWRQNVEAQVPGAPVVVLTQNPETSGTSWYLEHAKRRVDLLGYAKQKNLDCIDTYQAFLDAGWPGSLMLDAVHPNSTGSAVWQAAVLNRFNAS